jgi:hypothetical protein
MSAVTYKVFRGSAKALRGMLSVLAYSRCKDLACRNGPTNFEQHTFRGQVDLLAHCEPNPGSQSDLRSQPETQTSDAQKSGPKPQWPNLELIWMVS